MADEPQKAGSITLNASDAKTWLMIAAMVLGPAGVNKLALSGVETQQQRVSENTVRAVAKQETAADDARSIIMMLGEMRVKIEGLEAAVKELQEQQKKGTK